MYQLRMEYLNQVCVRNLEEVGGWDKGAIHLESQTSGRDMHALEANQAESQLGLLGDPLKVGEAVSMGSWVRSHSH